MNRFEQSRQLERRIYRWCYERADADGFVESSSAEIAHDLKIPLRTTQGVLSRLEGAGKLVAFGFRRIAVVELAE